MSWIADSEWIARRKNGEGLCDALNRITEVAYQGFEVLDAQDYEVCDQLATEIVVVGKQYCPRCPEHAETFRVDTAEVQARHIVRVAARCNGQEPLLA